MDYQLKGIEKYYLLLFSFLSLSLTISCFYSYRRNNKKKERPAPGYYKENPFKGEVLLVAHQQYRPRDKLLFQLFLATCRYWMEREEEKQKKNKKNLGLFLLIFPIATNVLRRDCHCSFGSLKVQVASLLPLPLHAVLWVQENWNTRERRVAPPFWQTASLQVLCWETYWAHAQRLLFLMLFCFSSSSFLSSLQT